MWLPAHHPFLKKVAAWEHQKPRGPKSCAPLRKWLDTASRTPAAGAEKGAGGERGWSAVPDTEAEVSARGRAAVWRMTRGRCSTPSPLPLPAFWAGLLFPILALELLLDICRDLHLQQVFHPSLRLVADQHLSGASQSSRVRQEVRGAAFLGGGGGRGGHRCRGEARPPRGFSHSRHWDILVKPVFLRAACKTGWPTEMQATLKEK